MNPQQSGLRRHGLYYPYFHIRDERWLKVAALYWPKIVRLIPEQFRTFDTMTVKKLIDELGFIDRQPPGASVEAVAPRVHDLLTRHGDALRARFGIGLFAPSVRERRIITGPYGGPEPIGGFLHRQDLPSYWEYSTDHYPLYDSALAMIHPDELTAPVRDALVESGLARVFSRPPPQHKVSNIGIEDFARAPEVVPVKESHRWMLMHKALVSAYTSMLAEDFAEANRLQPITDQQDAYVITSDWPSDRIAAALLDDDHYAASHVPAAGIAETLGFLALDLVIPAKIGSVPIDKIIEVRRRYESEFLSFGAEVDKTAGELAELSDIRDLAILNDYVREVVAERFARPLEEISKQIRSLKLDTATMAINIRTELPAGTGLAAGAMLLGHPLIAASTAVAVGLLSMRRGIRRQRATILNSAPAASFLLHTREGLTARSVLGEILHRYQRIAM